MLVAPLSAAYVEVDGKWCDAKYAPIMSASEHFHLGYAELNNQNFEEALRQFSIVTLHFTKCPEYDEAIFYSGVCYYFLAHFDLADEQFSSYLSSNNALEHYEDVFRFKLFIAKRFAKGAPKHLGGYKFMPRVIPGTDDAVRLFDEVIASQPTEELAAQALYSKSMLLREKRQYRESIEALLLLARRFPKEELAPESYLLISDIYLEQGLNEPQNPDLVSLAKINLEKFQKSFPGDERVSKIEQNILQMQRAMCSNLYETGRYWERKNKPKASEFYYREALTRCPENEISGECRERLAQLEKP